MQAKIARTPLQKKAWAREKWGDANVVNAWTDSLLQQGDGLIDVLDLSVLEQHGRDALSMQEERGRGCAVEMSSG